MDVQMCGFKLKAQSRKLFKRSGKAKAKSLKHFV